MKQLLDELFESALFELICSLLLKVQFVFEDIKNKVWKHYVTQLGYVVIGRTIYLSSMLILSYLR